MRIRVVHMIGVLTVAVLMAGLADADGPQSDIADGQRTDDAYVEGNHSGIAGLLGGIVMYASHGTLPRAVSLYSKAVTSPGIAGSGRSESQSPAPGKALVKVRQLVARPADAFRVASARGSDWTGTQPREVPPYSNVDTLQAAQRCRLVRQLIASGRYDAAVRQAGVAVRQTAWPYLPQLLVLGGSAQLLAGDSNQAVLTFMQVEGNFPGDPYQAIALAGAAAGLSQSQATADKARALADAVIQRYGRSSQPMHTDAVMIATSIQQNRPVSAHDYAAYVTGRYER